MYPLPMSTSNSPNTASNGFPVQYQNSSTDTIPSSIASAIKRQPNDPILWFANPPMNVSPQLGSTAVHSVSYLNWKRQQQQQNQQP